MKFYLFILCCFTASLFSIDKLRIYDEFSSETPIYVTSDFSQIAQQLNAIGIRFEQWETNQPLQENASEDEIFNAYKKEIENLQTQEGYATVDIVKMTPENPKKTELRNKFLNEHTHTEDEVRLFVEGSGLFYLHRDEKVFLVLCEKGDLISIPAHYPHWFDMGNEPSFIAIRFFTDPSGWVAHFTDDPIAKQFPSYDHKP